jgi:hypothetical protein
LASKCFLHLKLWALACGLISAPAFANNFPDNLSNHLRYRVSGTIPASCSLTQGPSSIEVIGLQDPATDTVRSTSTDLPFSISCTTAVQVSLASLNGGLQSGQTTSDTDFVSLVKYQATLDLPGASAALECQSGAMNSGGCRRALTNQALEGNGRIRLRTQVADDLLIAGTYRDTVTLTISPRLDGSSATAASD